MFRLEFQTSCVSCRQRSPPANLFCFSTVSHRLCLSSLIRLYLFIIVQLLFQMFSFFNSFFFSFWEISCKAFLSLFTLSSFLIQSLAVWQLFFPNRFILLRCKLHHFSFLKLNSNLLDLNECSRQLNTGFYWRSSGNNSLLNTASILQWTSSRCRLFITFFLNLFGCIKTFPLHIKSFSSEMWTHTHTQRHCASVCVFACVYLTYMRILCVNDLYMLASFNVRTNTFIHTYKFEGV